MRTIKFRAFDKENKKMVDNFLVNKDAIMFYAKLYHIGEPGYDTETYYDKTWQQKYVLMQFTGLYDRNGKEIWESDLVKGVYGYEDEPLEIVWDYAGFRLKRSNGWFLDIPTSLGIFEVIGDIYQNPNLLTN